MQTRCENCKKRCVCHACPLHNLIIEKIQYEVGHRLSRKKAEAIWNRAYEDGHSFGFYEIRCRLSDLIDLAITLLGGDK